ncbi:FAD/NAD(P)-binding domain-containing protein [Trichocladium antarcticum]|uniref:FAD/NAD(P)-binding domain-containing protein n=1 Tax=Trichocladium antarcticum TaxID=1450529 RepID=A0AAN6UKM7_9PEZI|nr:FAD/NAD(P)-binding domain-containing protein [Trichocladium antarcticum]
MASRSRAYNPITHPILFLFQLFQWLADKILSPRPPGPSTRLSGPKIAIIGAGITGVTSAAHCIGHGFDVTLFEAGGEAALGGIWSRVNNTSSLQIHSIMYRFHPSVQWARGYPDRAQILSEVRQLWQRYGLDTRTRFHTQVERVYQDNRGRWIVNDASLGRFDGVITAVGTCGAPRLPAMPGMDRYQGAIHHSSRLTGACAARDKTVVVIGGGASAVEALEFAHDEGARKVCILARSDKWIIPRSPVWNMLLALNIFGRQTRLSWIPELVLRRLFYRDLADLAPAGKGLFTDTPVVNSDIMAKLRSGEAEWIRCDIEGFTDTGVRVNRRAKGVAPGGPGRPDVIEGDVVVMATGFARPELSFLPPSCFQAPYEPPNWYLQTFPPNHPSISCINCTYVNAIGTVGNWHIGIYTRILLMFLTDPLTRPSPFWMERWIDMTRLLKAASPVGPFEFFTYLELLWWFAFCVAFNPFRWKWAFFVFFGLGFMLPAHVVKTEDRIRNGLGRRGDAASGEDVGLSL